MKTLFTYIIIASSITGYAQESMETTMEKRAKEMHRVISEGDKNQWRKFIKENYTQALIDKPMRATVKESGPGASSTSPEAKAADNLEAKVNMFERLNGDFGGSKITSIKSTGENIKMTLDNGSGLIGIFQLKFDKNKPYLIDGLGIQAEN